MKNLIFTIIIAVITLNCSKSDSENQNNIPPELIGKWKVIEVYSTDGGSPAVWSSYDSGYEYDIWFKNDGIFMITGTTNTDCMSGNFVVSGNDITYSNSICASNEPVTIELLNETDLLINLNHFEPYKTKYKKIVE